MFKSIISLFAILSFFQASSQIGFNEHLIADETFSAEGANSVYAVDIDGDGDLDILASSRNDGTISLFRNYDGQGNFKIEFITTNIPSLESIHAADLDGDGDIDIVAVSSATDTVFWYKNTDGLGTFAAPQTIVSGFGNPIDVISADLDGDNDLDIIVGFSGANRVSWFENTDGAGNFGNIQDITLLVDNVSQIAAGDIDNDGDIDILSATAIDDKLAWYENTDGLGTFGAQQIIVSLENAHTISVADFDGDGDLDVVGSSGLIGALSWYENVDGQGAYGASHLIANTGANNLFTSQYPADVDGDGDTDIVVVLSSTNQISWYENTDNVGNVWVEHIVTTNSYLVNFVSAADLDNDGDIDILATVGGDEMISWFENTDSLGNFSEGFKLNNYPAGPESIYVADLDGDGDNDLLASSRADNELVWFKNLDGMGYFSDQILISDNPGNPTSSNQNSLIAKDIDNDGDLDLINCANNKLAWYENTDGQGNFVQRVIEETIIGGSTVYAVDLDGDTDLDLLVSKSSVANKSEVLWYKNTDGLGNFEAQDVFANSNIYDNANAFSDDLDGDGDFDVLIIYRFEHKVVWHKNLDGQGNFGPEIMINASVNEGSSVHTGDIDGDGDKDVMSTQNLSVLWYENTDGLGSFSAPNTVHNVGMNSGYMLDVDNDGDLDIITSRQSQNGTVAWHANLDGQGTFGTQQIVSQTSATPRALHYGDIDGDGDPDIASASWHDSKIAWYENLGETFNEIRGVVRLNTTGVACDTSLPVLQNIMAVTSNGTDTFATFTLSTGLYQLFPTQGTFTTHLEDINYYESSPLSHNSTFTASGEIDIADFCLEPNVTANDLNITLFPLNMANPGFDSRYQIVYNNVGTTTLSGSVTLFYQDANMTFLTASEPVASQSANAITFDYLNLSPFETRTIDLEFNVSPPPINQNDDILHFTATIDPTLGDETEYDNSFELNQTVVGSYDPNDIRVLEGEEIFIEDVDKFLHYIIRFQNTGTASAINIKVTNQIDPNLDWSTFQLQNLSHPGTVLIRNENQVTFSFDNINLPDATTNEPASHGYIQFKIKPKAGITIGESILNSASIYFDFNLPILTNTVTTTVVENLLPVIANQPSDLDICSDNGVGLFDLNINSDEILGTQDPTSFAITYHETLADATNGVNPIVNSALYQNLANPQTIYPRLERLSDGEFDTTSFNLIVLSNPSPTVPTPLEICDDDHDGFAQFTLTDKNAEIINGEPNVSISYHETLLDANNSVNALVGPYINTVEHFQTIFARVSSTITSCYSIVSLDLVVVDTPVVVPVTDLVVLDVNGDGFANFDLTSKIPEIIGAQTDLEVSFYESLAGATAATNPIVTPTNYVNLDNPQTIYTRLTNFTDGCFAIGEFNIYADPELGYNEVELNAIKIYPNPTSNQLHLESQISILKVILYNNLGQEIMIFRNDNGLKILNLDTLASGLFFMKIFIDQDRIAYKKIIKK